jgi:phage-related protein (TIGR01555 family)
MAVDIIGDDMTKRGVDIKGQIDPFDIERLYANAEAFDLWTQTNDIIRWSQLYGGAIGVMLIDGQRMDTPLRIETVGNGQFKGLYVLDRWAVEPSLSDLVTDFGPWLGLPKFYTVYQDSTALRNQKIHYSRVLRMEGVRLPFQQRMMENSWGISIFERLFDRMVAFDSATTGAAQLVHRSYLRTYGIKGLREAIAAGGPAQRKLEEFVRFMARFQSIEGVTLIDAEDVFAEHGGAATGARGIADLILKFGEQISGALQIPLVRLFGQSPSGLNSAGESELRTYYDGINMRQNRTLRNPVTTIYRVLAQSLGIKLPPDFGIEFRPLWILNDAEKAGIAGQVASAVASVDQAGIIMRATALKELKQSSRVTNIFTNISNDEIAAAEQEPPPGVAEAMQLQQQQTSMEQGAEQHEKQMQEEPEKKKSKDSVSGNQRIMGFDVVVEHQRGEMRYGAKLPASYGYLRRTDSAERGDQMDCFIGPKLDGFIYIIDAYRVPEGQFDEHKVCLGFPDKESALAVFRNYYGRMAERTLIGKTNDPVSPEDLQVWLATGDLTKPFYEPTDVRYVAVAENPEERCRNCKYFDAQICSNHAVHHDPRVPETFDGLKVVAPSGWCAEFSPVRVTETERQV